MMQCCVYLRLLAWKGGGWLVVGVLRFFVRSFSDGLVTWVTTASASYLLVYV